MAKTGERKAQILQTLAAMLEDPKGERITTALLAARLEVSEAALYRHFSSKAQMFEGLIEFIEQTVFTLVNKIQAEEKDPMKQVEATVATLLGFAQKNPGMTRVLIGDALVNEDERLQARVNQLIDRLEASLRQSARLAVSAGTLPADWDVNAYANAVIAFVIGTFLVDILGPALNLPDVVQQLALTRHVGEPMLGTWDPGGLVACLVLAVGGLGLGAWGLRRRDVAA